MSATKRKLLRASQPLVELSLTAAARNLGTTEITLQRKLGARGIQQNARGKFFIRDLVNAMGTNGEITSKEISLQAHGRLEGHKAKLVELEILEKEKELVRRPAVLGFLESLGKRLHQVIETFDSVEREERNRLHEVIGETGKEFIRAEGWPMLSLAEIKELRTAFPYLETEPELWGRQRAYDFYERPTAAE